MPGEHANLSPSAAEMWLECPASLGMELLVPPEPESAYAHEGTVAHELGYLKASLEFKKITKAQFVKRRAAWREENVDLLDQDEVEAEMELHTDAYVELLKERMSLYPDSQILLEQRMDTGIPESWGTGDAVIFSPQHVEIVDFKYGSGVAVEAHGNPQLRSYGLGALDTFADILGDTEVVRMTVHQPRMDHILTEEMTPEALREWRESIIPVAKRAAEIRQAVQDDPDFEIPEEDFGPSEVACRWCPASGRCKPQLKSIFDNNDFEAEPATLEPEELAKAVGEIPRINAWVKAVEKAALDTAYSQGVPVPGYKVVLSGGQRSVRDHKKALEVLISEGFKVDEVAATKVRGIGDLEKLLGKERFKELLEDTGIVAKSDGRPALVKESDRRQSITPNIEAARDFSPVEQED